MTPRNRRKQLPKLERRPLVQREHKPKKSDLPVNPDKKQPYIRKLPKRTYRTPMAIAVCSSQTTLTPVGSKANENRVVYNKSKGDNASDIRNNKFTKQIQNTMKQNYHHYQQHQQQQHHHITHNSLPFPIKTKTSKNSSNNFLTSQFLSDSRQIIHVANNNNKKQPENISEIITEALTEKISDHLHQTNTIQINTDKITERNSNSNNNNSSTSDINYSVLVNGKVHPKRIKPFTGERHDKYATKIYSNNGNSSSNTSKQLRSITSLNSLINSTKVAKQITYNSFKNNHNKQQQQQQFYNSKSKTKESQQKTVSVVDMSSWLHRGNTFNQKRFHSFKVNNRSNNLWHPNQII